MLTNLARPVPEFSAKTAIFGHALGVKPASPRLFRPGISADIVPSPGAVMVNLSYVEEDHQWTTIPARRSDRLNCVNSRARLAVLDGRSAAYFFCCCCSSSSSQAAPATAPIPHRKPHRFLPIARRSRQHRLPPTEPTTSDHGCAGGHHLGPTNPSCGLIADPGRRHRYNRPPLTFRSSTQPPRLCARGLVVVTHPQKGTCQC